MRNSCGCRRSSSKHPVYAIPDLPEWSRLARERYRHTVSGRPDQEDQDAGAVGVEKPPNHEKDERAEENGCYAPRPVTPVPWKGLKHQEVRERAGQAKEERHDNGGDKWQL